LIATSNDGNSWRSASGPALVEMWGGVAHGNDIYLAIGMFLFGSISEVITSTDLQTWSVEPLDFRAMPKFGPGYFVLLGMFGDNRIAITMEGKNFEKVDVAFSNSKDATFDADTWVVVGPGGSIFSSPD